MGEGAKGRARADRIGERRLVQASVREWIDRSARNPQTGSGREPTSTGFYARGGPRKTCRVCHSACAAATGGSPS